MSRSPGKIFIIILALAAFLRLYALDRMALWGDEACMIYLCAKSPEAIVKALASEDRPDVDVAPPLYFLMLHAWMNLFGNSVAAFRGFSVLFGILTVISAGKLGSILFDRKTGLAAAFLTAIHPFQIWYSQEGRMYSLATFLSVTTILSFAYTLKKPERFTGWFALAVSGVLLIYTQYYGALLLLTIVVYATLELTKSAAYRAKALRRIIGVILFWVAAYCPWLPVLLTDYRHAGASGGFPLMFHWLLTPIFLFAKFVLYGVENYVRDTMWLYPIPLIAACVLLYKSLKQWHRPGVRLLVFSFGIPFGIVYGLSIFGMRVYKSHPFIMFHPAFLVLLAYGFTLLPPICRRITGVLFTGALFYVTATLVLAGDYQKPRVHDIAEWIVTRSGPDAAVAVIPAFIPNPMPIVGDLLAFRYHSGDRMNAVYLVGETSEDLVKAIVTHAENQDTIYVVFQQNIHVQPYVDKVLQALNRIWTPVQQVDFRSRSRDFSMAVIQYETQRLQDHQ
jgi:4-amino-4-deoxy-L-arabinose transferase-like glycosyltransferase